MTRPAATREQALALKARGLTPAEVARELRVGRTYAIELLRKPAEFAERSCELCGETFAPRSGRQRFCTPEHQQEHRQRRRRREAVAGWERRVAELEAELVLVRAELGERE